jgi:O-antigen/teichoic acid export membrane protein
MLKAFLKDSLIYSISNILARGINMLLVPFYTRVLSPSDYGLIDIITVVIAIINPLLTFEISQGIARFYCETKSKIEQKQYASTALWFTICTYSIFVIASFLIPTSLLKQIFNEQMNTTLYMATIAYLWSNGLTYLIQNQLKWSLRSKLCAISSLTCTVISVTFTIIFVVVFKLGVLGVILGLTIGNLFSGLLGVYYTRDIYGFVFDVDKLKQLISFSIPLVPSILGVMVALYIDRLVIKEFLSLREVGLYGIGYRISTIVNLLMVGVQGALMPLVYKHYQEENTPVEIARIFRYFIAFALLIFGGLTVFSQEILILLTTPQYYDAGKVIPFLVLAVVLSGMFIFSPGLGIAKKTKLVAVLNIVSAVINTLLSLMMVPLFGIIGAALGTLLSSLMMFIAYQFFSQKIYFIPHDWQKIIVSAIGIIVLSTLGVIIHSNELLLTLAVKIILMFLQGTFIVMYLIGYKEFQEKIIQLFRLLHFKSKG